MLNPYRLMKFTAPDMNDTRWIGIAMIWVALLVGAVPTDAEAQDRPRVGLGFNSVISTEDGFGPGVRLRVSSPINRDLSIAIGSAFTGYILGGRDEASYALDPQVSLIVTRTDTPTQGTYFMGGAGAYLPINTETSTAAPTLHLGIGRVWLLEDTSVFAEFNPALVIGEDATSALLSLRFGVIF